MRDAPKNAFVRHPKDPLPPWHDSAELFRRCEDIVGSRFYNIIHTRCSISVGTFYFVVPIRRWDHFGRIFWRHWDMISWPHGSTLNVYVNNNQVSIRIICHHFHQLMVLNLHRLSPIAICGCFARFPCDVILISEADLRRLVPWIW